MARGRDRRGPDRRRQVRPEPGPRDAARQPSERPGGRQLPWGGARRWQRRQRPCGNALLRAPAEPAQGSESRGGGLLPRADWCCASAWGAGLHGSIILTVNNCCGVSAQAGRDGLDADSLTKGLRQLGYDVDRGEAQHLMRQLDTAKTGRIQSTELAAGIIDWKALQVRQ
jgi:hypothetical protein